jgi:hypothetical protein
MLRQIPVVNHLLPPSERVDGEVAIYRVALLPPRRSCPQQGLCYDGVLNRRCVVARLRWRWVVVLLACSVG